MFCSSCWRCPLQYRSNYHIFCSAKLLAWFLWSCLWCNIFPTSCRVVSKSRHIDSHVPYKFHNGISVRSTRVDCIRNDWRYFGSRWSCLCVDSSTICAFHAIKQKDEQISTEKSLFISRNFGIDGCNLVISEWPRSFYCWRTKYSRASRKSLYKLYMVRSQFEYRTGVDR